MMASCNSPLVTYSSAVWERDESPGSIFKEGKGIRAWSESVGEPKGVRPMARARATSGWHGLVRNISSGYVSTYHGSTSNYRSGIHIDYDYDTNWNDNYETLTQNYYAVGRSNVDKPARKMSVLRKNNEKKSRGNENPETVK